MKKSMVLIAILLIIFSFSNTAFCAQGPYMSLNAGISIAGDSDLTDSTAPGIIVEMESDTGFALSGALGHDFGNNFRLEGEVSYISNEIDKASLLGINLAVTGDVTSIAFLVNGYIDFKNSTPFTPFVGVGAGFANVELDDFNVVGSGLPPASEDDTVFAYQLSLGVAYAVTEKMTLDVKYRYFATSDIEIDTSEYEYASHGFLLGLRFNF